MVWVKWSHFCSDSHHIESFWIVDTDQVVSLWMQATDLTHYHIAYGSKHLTCFLRSLDMAFSFWSPSSSSLTNCCSLFSSRAFSWDVAVSCSLSSVMVDSLLARAASKSPACCFKAAWLWWTPARVKYNTMVYSILLPCDAICCMKSEKIRSMIYKFYRI